MMNKIKDEMESIFKLNNLNIKVQIISAVEADNLALDNTDAILMLNQEGFNREGESFIFSWGSIGTGAANYLRTGYSQREHAELQGRGTNIPLERIIATKAVHEIGHQYIERAKILVFGSRSRDGEGHFNDRVNIMMNKASYQKTVLYNPTNKNITDWQKFISYHNELIKVYLESQKQGGCDCVIENYKSKVNP